MQQEMLPGYESGILGGQERYAADSRLYVEFYRKAVHNPFKSAQEGRPIFDEKDFVKIMIPGDKYSSVDTQVTTQHQQRFPTQWARYQAGQEQATSGTPLESWPQMTVGMVASLKAVNISTVEQLAELSDANASQIMGNHDLRRRAKAFLEAAAGEAVNAKLEAELEKRDNEIETLKNQMAQLMQSAAKTPQAVATKAANKE
jgi:hypothetical protein